MALGGSLLLPVGEQDHVRGDPAAPVTLVEYGDFECPHCARARPIVERIMVESGDKVRMVFRHFPLIQIHPHALAAALAAEAAGRQGSFWRMHNTLFDNQEDLSDEALIRYARKLDLDIDRFILDMNSREVELKVLQDIDSGFRSGVYGTPTFFINGRRHDDSYEYEVLFPAVKLAIESAVGQPVDRA